MLIISNTVTLKLKIFTDNWKPELMLALQQVPEEYWTLFQQLWKYATPEHMKENVQ